MSKKKSKKKRKFNKAIWDNAEQRDFYLKAYLIQGSPKKIREFSMCEDISYRQWLSLKASGEVKSNNIKNKKSKLSSISYPEYLQTKHWQDQRKFIRKRDGGKCRFCSSRNNLHVHHRTYARRGEVTKEREDLCLLCAECHDVFHKHVAIDGKIRHNG